MKILIASLLSLLLCHCAPSTQFLSPDYQGKDFSGQTLRIFPPAVSQLHIISMEDFEDDFGEIKENKEAFLAQLTEDEISSGFKAGAHQIEITDDSAAKPVPDSATQKFSESIGDKTIEVRIPKKEFLDSNGIKARFALIFGAVTYERKTSGGPGWSLMAPIAIMGPVSLNAGKSGGGGSKALTASLDYLIYDYGENKPVAYGQANGVAHFSFAMTRSDWYVAAKDAARRILEKSPFKSIAKF